MKQTPHYGLKKPEESDYAAIEMLNENADKIDTALDGLEKGKAPAVHSHTAAQAGLGNVPNVSTNNQTPTFSVAAVLAGLVSGETLALAFGKLAKAVVELIAHLVRRDNPHAVTYQQAGAEQAGAVATHNTGTIAHVDIRNAVANAQATANDAKSLAEGRSRAVSYAGYATMTAAVNLMTKTAMRVGDNLLLEAMGVPDLWVCRVEAGAVVYAYTTDAALEADLALGPVQMGYYKLSVLETPKVDLSGYVPKATRINGKALTGDITLTAGDVEALPLTGGTMTGRLTLAGAPSSPTDAANKGYVDGQVAGVHQIGDTLITARTNLGVKWLLCNGAIVSKASYPVLWNELPSGKSLGDVWDKADLVSEQAIQPQESAYGNGYWVIICNNVLYYSVLSPKGPWVVNPQAVAGFKSVILGNGYWVAVGLGGGIWYKEGNPTGIWGAATSGTTQLLHSIAYGNGYWVATGNYRTAVYKAGVPSGAWTKFDVGLGNSQCSFDSVAYGNGYWVIGQSNNSYGYAYINGSPTGKWVISAAMVGRDVLSIAYGGGHWLIGSTSGAVYYAENPTVANWTVKSLGWSTQMKNISYENGIWFCCEYNGQSIKYCIGAPSGVWADVHLGSSLVGRVRFGNGAYAVAGANGTTSPVRYLVTEKTLPELVADKAYTYIRALM